MSRSRFAVVEVPLDATTEQNWKDYANAHVGPRMGERRLQPGRRTAAATLLADGRVKRDRNGEMFKYWSTRVANGESPTPRDSRARDATASPPTWVRPPGAGGTAGTLRESEAATEVPERAVLLGPRPADKPDKADPVGQWRSRRRHRLLVDVPGFGESLIEAEADYATGRTSGEEEIRTRFGLPARGRSRPAATWQQNVRPPEASLVSDRPETISDPWSVLGR